MSRVRFTRVVAFSATHRYFRPDWTAEQNARAFGSHAGEAGHEHRYECHVTVDGTLSDDTNMVISLDTFDQILQDEIVQRLDRRHLNDDLPEFRTGRSIPTTEALAVYIWNHVAPRLAPGIRLAAVRVYEDPSLYAEYRGGEERQ